MRRIVLVHLIAALTVAAIAAPARAATPTAEPGAEQDSLALVNDARTSRGKRALAWDGDLARIAREHSMDMASDGELRHNDRLGGQVDGGWEELGENVGYGPSPTEIHDAFMGSDVHRDNILGPFDSVGIGAVRDDNGTLWLTQVFMRGGSDGGDGGGTTRGVDDEPRIRSRKPPLRSVTYRAATVARVRAVRAPRARAVRPTAAAGLTMTMLGRVLGDDGAASAGTATGTEGARSLRYS